MVLAFDRAGADDDRVAVDRGGRLQVQRRLHLPADLSARGVEAEQGEVLVVVQALADQQEAAVGRERGGAEEGLEVLVAGAGGGDRGGLPEGLARLGVEAEDRAVLPGDVELAGGAVDAVPRDQRRRQEHRRVLVVLPEALEPERRGAAVVAAAAEVPAEAERDGRRAGLAGGGHRCRRRAERVRLFAVEDLQRHLAQSRCPNAIAEAFAGERVPPFAAFSPPKSQKPPSVRRRIPPAIPKGIPGRERQSWASSRGLKSTETKATLPARIAGKRAGTALTKIGTTASDGIGGFGRCIP